MGQLLPVGEVFPETKYQRCTVHFYREKAKAVVEELRSMKLKEAAKKKVYEYEAPGGCR